jgi:hypothetical protein
MREANSKLVTSVIEMQRIPKTTLVRKAIEVCTRSCPDWLQKHCYRTYAFGALLGGGRMFDHEALFVAAMLHDVGLTDAYEEGNDPGDVPGYERKNAPCFAVRGADVAGRLARVYGTSRAEPDLIAEAIALHLNVRVAPSRGLEAHLLNAGSAFDVSRLRSHRVAPQMVLAVEERWPRGGTFCQDLVRMWERESRAHTRCRGAFLDRWLLFKHQVRRTCAAV